MVIPNNKLLRVQIPLGRGVLDTTLCEKVCQGLAESQWFSLGTPSDFLHQQNWNIVESGVKHHNPNTTGGAVYTGFNVYTKYTVNQKKSYKPLWQKHHDSLYPQIHLLKLGTKYLK